MANDEHLVILKEGVEVWNEWRLENSILTPILRNANLNGSDLRGVNLWNANLAGADLSAANLAKANLNEANLKEANLNHANLNEAELSKTDLWKADLTSANLTSAVLAEADLTIADLTSAILTEADLTDANLSWADLSNADLVGAEMRWANLSATNMNKSNLSKANLSRTQVVNTNFYSATLTGACIKDWNVNSGTKFDEVICEYVYTYDFMFDLDIGNYRMSGEEFSSWIEMRKKESRRPINGNFEPGEFASLYKKIIENTDLILRKNPQNDNNVNNKDNNINLDNTSNNQGVKFYSNSTIHTWERLRFRSKTEIKIAEALDRTGVLFVPNSLARLTTPKGRENKEADFLICYNGKWGVLEVDGPFHTAERRVEEQERERIFKKNGIKVVERFDSERCYNNPDEVVQEFFKMIEIGYS
ncbi:MAG: pentapeptide repeat-containing protein [Dolichospermum sp.]